MITFYVAVGRHLSRMSTCDGYSSVRKATECMKNAGDYVYAMENGVGRELTAEEKRHAHGS